MIGETIIIGLQLLILAGLANNKEHEVLHKSEQDKHESEVINQKHSQISCKRHEPKISNTGERFAECPLVGYQSRYLVGDWGTIKKRNGEELKKHKSQNGKEYVNLLNSTRATTCTVERLVALTFLVRPAKGDERSHKILHKNGVLSDNRAVNLMWK